MATAAQKTAALAALADLEEHSELIRNCVRGIAESGTNLYPKIFIKPDISGNHHPAPEILAKLDAITAALPAIQEMVTEATTEG